MARRKQGKIANNLTARNQQTVLTLRLNNHLLLTRSIFQIDKEKNLTIQEVI